MKIHFIYFKIKMCFAIFPIIFAINTHQGKLNWENVQSVVNIEIFNIF